MDLVPRRSSEAQSNDSDVLQGEIIGETIPEPPYRAPGARVFNCSGCCGPLTVGAIALSLLLFKGLYGLLDYAVGGIPQWFQQLLTLVFVVPPLLIIVAVLLARIAAIRKR